MGSTDDAVASLFITLTSDDEVLTFSRSVAMEQCRSITAFNHCSFSSGVGNMNGFI